MTRSKIFGAAAAMAALFTVASVMGQMYLDGSAKARGDYSGHSAGRSLGNARSYSRDYRTYAQSVPKVDPEVARDAADEIGGYIKKAQKHFAWMRSQAEKANDKESLTSLDEIDKNLAAASKSHHEMHDMCLKANIEAAGSMKCCQQIDESLAKAIAEHDKLMKRLGLPVPAPAKK
jgi:hypothetical protein